MTDRDLIATAIWRHRKAHADHRGISEATDNDLALAILAALAAAGLVIANTHPVEDARLAVGRGGLSGAPLFGDTARMVAEARNELGGDTALIACGGVGSADQVWRLLEAGASAVQIGTASFVNPNAGVEIVEGLRAYCQERGIERLDVLVGALST